MRSLRVAVGVTLVAVMVAVTGATVSAADTLKPMGPRMLQQMVLRAQMPTTLGSWQQYLYQAMRGGVPTLCYSGTGAVELPKAAGLGMVNYQVDQGTNGSVTVFQYATAAKAKAALKALRSMGCSDTAVHPTEAGTLVPATQGSDFMDAARNSVGSAISYDAGDGTRGYESTITTQRGLAVIQTQVRSFVTSAQTVTQQQDAIDRLGAVNEAWHKQVMKAYVSFGIEATAS